MDRSAFADREELVVHGHHHQHQQQQKQNRQASSPSGFTAFSRACIVVLLMFVVLLMTQWKLQSRGVLPSPSPQMQDSFPLAQNNPSTAFSSSVPQARRGDFPTTTVGNTLTTPQSLSSSSPVVATLMIPPDLSDNAGYWRQPSAIFRDPTQATPGYDSAAFQSPAAGVLTEQSLNDEFAERKPGRVMESQLFHQCFNKFSALSVQPVETSGVEVMEPPLLLAHKRVADPDRGGTQVVTYSSDAPFYRYDVVLFPVGCFGEAIAKPKRGWGSSHQHQQQQHRRCRLTSCVAIEQLSKFVSCAKRPVGLILGDNFYPRGIERRDPGRLAREFKIKFLRHQSFAKMSWYGQLGNHDHRPERQFSPKLSRRRRRGEYDYEAGNEFSGSLKNVSQQSAAASAASWSVPTWIMPAAHQVTPLIKTDNVSVQVFLVSTQWGGANNAPHMADEAQWLDQELSKSTADVKIVTSHEPIFGFLNFAHSAPLIDHVHPVLLKHGVPLYIAAHTHSVHFHRCSGGYYQLVSAGFADNLHPGVRYKRPRGHFFVGRGATAVAINGTHVVITAVNLQGRHVFHFAFDWKKVVSDVKGWNGDDGAGGGSRRRKEIEENEIGGPELWQVEEPCTSGSVRASAPWCPLKK